MKPVRNRIRKHYGLTAKRVAVRSQRPWYFNALIGLVLVFAGYIIAYWQFTGGKLSDLIENMTYISRENQTLHVRSIQIQRELQVERAAQTNLAKELVDLQDEAVKLKQDVEFYKNIVKEKPPKH